IKKNIFFLLFVQGTNYLFPLLTFPYISHIIGPDGFGKIALSQAIITYLMFVIDFGFNLTITRRISIYHKDGNEQGIRKLFICTICAKLIIFMMVITITTPVIFLIDKLRELRFLVLMGYLSLIGSVFFPVWYFQGIQKMKGIAIASSGAKILCIAAVFILVRNEDDLLYVMFIYSLNFLTAALVSLFYIKKDFFYIRPEYSIVKKIVVDAFPIFVSYIGSSIYTTVNVFFLGLFLPASQVGLYSSGDKIRAVAQNVLSPISQAVFPNLSSYIYDRKKFNKKHKKYSLYFLMVSFSISLLLFIFSQRIVSILLDSRFNDSYKILMVLAFLPFVVSIAIVFGQWGLVNIGKQNVLSKIYLISGMFHLVHIFFAIHFFGGIGAAYSVLFTESFVSLLMIIFFIKYNKEYYDDGR
ncbi:flippase, partial [Klebsiella michiganensis]